MSEKRIKKISLNVEGNLGYGPDQINTKVTLADLLEQVEEAITEWGEETEVVLYQTNNSYGANYGRIERYELFSVPDTYQEWEE